METRQIVAVVLIVIIIAGVGVGVFLFLPAPYGAIVIGQLVTPGAPAGTPSDRIIRVGLLDPMTEIQGEGAWRGAYLAVDELNTAGGIIVDGETYYFGLIAEDTHEADAELDTSKGIAAATKIVTEDNAQFILAGFRTEALLAYEEIIMDEKLLLFGIGSSTDVFCQNVLDDYDRYKYFFRITPINSTSLASTLFRYTLYLDGYLTAVTGYNISKVAIIREGLDWTAGMSTFLNAYLPAYNLTIVEEIPFPMTSEAADFATYWTDIDNAGAQITIPIISGSTGILMSTQYGIVQPKTLVAGINVMSQLDTYWAETGGGCQYETILQTAHRTNKTPTTIAWWDNFIDKFGIEPLYTALGAYDAVNMLSEGIVAAQSFNSTEIIPYLEDFDIDNYFEGAGGNIAFTPGHDVFEGYIGDTIYSVALLCQWQANGAKAVVATGGLIYPDSIATAALALPSWGINE